MSWSQRNELWRRWRAGESLTDIASALQRNHSRVYHIVEAEGGIAPPPRRRADRAVTTTEREEISRGLARGESLRGLAPALRRAVAEKLRHQWSPQQIAGWLRAPSERS
jgi:IS30 family transposase